MRLSYDAETDSLYIHFTEEPSVDADEIAPGVVVDYGKDGRIVGLDIDHASKLLDLTRIDMESVPLSPTA